MQRQNKVALVPGWCWLPCRLGFTYRGKIPPYL